MQPIFVILNDFIQSASNAEKQVITYIIENSEKCVNTSIYDLAKNTYTSPSTIVKLFKKLGFKGFKDFKYNLIMELASKKSIVKDYGNANTVKDIALDISSSYISSLNHTSSIIDLDVIENVLTKIINANTIYLFGIGSSFLVARDFEQKMLRLGKVCVLVPDYHMQLLHSKNITKDCIAIVFSYSGQTKEVYECCKNIKNRGATIISITRLSSSKISKISDFNLYTSNQEDIVRSGALSSRICQLYIVDILYSYYISKKFKNLMYNINNTRIFKEEE